MTERLRGAPSPRLLPEHGGWSVILPGVPVAADATHLDDAIDEMILALRDYADDWQARLLNAPNHRNSRALVQMVKLSDDARLRDWLMGHPAAASGSPDMPRD